MTKTEYGHSMSFICQNWDSYPAFMHAKGGSSGTPFERSLEKVGESHLNKQIDRDGQPHDDRNTWNNWHLIPTSRPTFAMPSQKTNTVEIPGTDGYVDLSYALTKYPTFGNREGSFEFIVENDFKPWQILYSEIAAFLHGQRLRCVLEDDPEYYYEGRFWIDNWKSNNDGTWSNITLGYSVEPYKTAILSTADAWLWDPFNFYTGVIPTGFFNCIELTNTNAELETELSDLTDSSGVWKKTIELTGLQGKKPQCPIIYWTPNVILGDSAISLKRAALTMDYVNNSIGINYNSSGYKFFGLWISSQSFEIKLDKLSYGIDYIGVYNKDIFGQADNGAGKYYPDNIGTKTTYMFRDNDFILYDAYMRQNSYVRFRGNGYLTIEFNRGDL